MTIKHAAQNGGLLHSHIQTFPSGSKQQQVTAYHHKDSNNNWKVMKSLSEDQSESEVQIVRHGDTIRLLHNQTERHLHSHLIRAPVTITQWEVSGYGNLTHGDPNDEWIVEIVGEHVNYPLDGTLRSLTTKFLLRHRVLGCLLTAENGVYLPPWGFGQVEIKCDQRNQITSENSIWNIEQHWNDRRKTNILKASKPFFRAFSLIDIPVDSLYFPPLFFSQACCNQRLQDQFLGKLLVSQSSHDEVQQWPYP